MPTADAAAADAASSGAPAEATSSEGTAPAEQDPLWILLRVAGLSTVELEPFSSDLPRRLARLGELTRELESAREALVDRLYRAIPKADPEVRSGLLEAKRDAYNGRSLAPHRDKTASWAEVTRVAGESATRVLALEAELETALSDYETAYAIRRRAEHRQLLELRNRRSFVRGLALASPVLAAGIRRLRLDFDGDYDRKQRKAARSLLRYASRAVCKLSPYSTLTPVALAAVRDLNAGGEPPKRATDRPAAVQAAAELAYRPGPWSETSLLRARRFVPSQWVHLLFAHPPLRSRLRVALNGSLTETAPGRFLLLRPGGWTTTDEGRLEHRPDAVVTLALQGPLVAWLQEELLHREPIYHELLSELVKALTSEGEPAPTRDELTDAVERLLDTGLLVLRTPWPLYETHLEARLLEVLKEVSHEEELEEGHGALAPVIGVLERLVELELGYPQTEEPARAVRRLEGLLDEIWDALVSLVAPPRDIEGDWSGTSVFYEDVFLTPVASRAEGSTVTGSEHVAPRDGLLELPRDLVDELHETVAPLLRISDLANHRHDFRLALAARMERQWPQRTEVGFLELFAATQDLWKEFSRFDLAARRRSPGVALGGTFDPLDLPAAAELGEERRRVAEALSGGVQSDGRESRLERRELERIADAVPRRWSSPCAAGLLVQPADPSGRLWVLNRLAEGTGRLGSRFTPVMDPAIRRRILSHFVARSVLEHDGERFELLDLPSIQGDTLNVHAPQTLRLLEPPGETLHLPPERRVRLGELRLRRTGDGDLRLIDRRGRNLLPVHLGVADLVYLPVWARFLARLGPGELEILRPSSTVRTGEGLAIRERLTLGRLVLHRRRWRLAPERLPRKPARHIDPGTFVGLDRWRRELDLPPRFYVIERRPGPGQREVFKPQYLDLSSPLFADIFLEILDRQGGEPLVLEEALPTPDAFPRDGGEARRAVELVVEGLSLQTPLSPEHRTSEELGS